MYNENVKNDYAITDRITFFKELVGSEGLMMKNIILIILLLIAGSGPAFASQGAYNRGKAARTEMPPPIIMCDAEDKYNPGFLYDRGQGASQSRAEIVKWYQKAADHGNAMAQYRLGSMYLSGEGVPQDYIQAHLWFSLSAARGISDAAICRDNVAKKMTPQQIAKAHELVLSWEPKPWFELKQDDEIQQKKVPEEKSKQ